MRDWPGGRYLSRIQILKDAYPGLIQLLNKLPLPTDRGRQAIDSTYQNLCSRSPVRCAVLEFDNGCVHHQKFGTVNDLQLHFESIKNQPIKTTACRLYILEDLEPEFVETLGENLGIDPHVFAEQMNTWNCTDVESVGHRALPSLMQPKKAFTLRYYEFRKLGPKRTDESSIFCNQMTFAVNRRYYEPWLTIDCPSMPNEGPVAFVRRCASFWTSQSKTGPPGEVWNGK
jgi:hypothetical protein